MNKELRIAYSLWCQDKKNFDATNIPRTFQNFLDCHGHEYSRDEMLLNIDRWSLLGRTLIKKHLNDRLIKIWTEP